MKLPSFGFDDDFAKLKKTMGVARDVRWTPATRWKGISQADMRLLAGRGLDIAPTDISIGKDFTLEYKGLKVLLYIRDQQAPKPGRQSSFRFHISFCDTLQDMRNKNRFKRYVVSTNSGGIFTVNFMDFGRLVKKDVQIPLFVCKNCLSKLNYKNYLSAVRKDDIHRSFSLPEFFRLFGGTQFPMLPDDTPESQPLNQYPPDWPDISRRIRAERNYKCQGENCDRLYTRQQLDVHHIDGNKYNCRPANLLVLCHTCHQREHPHYHPQTR